MKITASIDLDFPVSVYLSRGETLDEFRRGHGETYSRILTVDGPGRLSEGGTRREREIARNALHSAGVAGF